MSSFGNSRTDTGIMVLDNPDSGCIRSLEIDGETWFVGTDVAEAPGYKNTWQALFTNVDAEDGASIRRAFLPYPQGMTLDGAGAIS